MGDVGLIPGWGRCPGEEKGYQLQYCDLENSMNCIVHGVAELDTTEWFSLSEMENRVGVAGLGLCGMVLWLGQACFSIMVVVTWSCTKVTVAENHTHTGDTWTSSVEWSNAPFMMLLHCNYARCWHWGGRLKGWLRVSWPLFQNQKFSKNEGRHTLPFICSPPTWIDWILETKARSDVVNMGRWDWWDYWVFEHCYSSMVQWGDRLGFVPTCRIQGPP